MRCWQERQPTVKPQLVVYNMLRLTPHSPLGLTTPQQLNKCVQVQLWPTPAFLDLLAMASNLQAMASNLIAMASNLINSNGLQPNSDSLQPNSDGLQPN